MNSVPAGMTSPARSNDITLLPASVSSTTCRTCGSVRTTCLGKLPAVSSFAGVQLAAPLLGGRLYLCGRCSFVFRSPVLTEEEYLALYRAGSEEVWEPKQAREDFRRVHALVPHAPIDVLDIGCYTGQFLAGLPESCRRYGVEPNSAAALKAAARGVRVVGRQLHEIDPALRYDIIVACDVIEHVANPLDFLVQAETHLKPGGKIIVTTGNARAWLWKLLRSRFWYCYFPEHISFISPAWLSCMAPLEGLAVERVERFSHDPPLRLGARFRSWAKLGMYAVWPAAYRQIRLRFAPGDSREAAPPGGGITKDHLLCVLVARRTEPQAP